MRRLFDVEKMNELDFIYTPVKLLFTTLCFVGLYSVPNLIVMLFNLLYPVFIFGFHCKGCVLERESMNTQATED